MHTVVVTTHEFSLPGYLIAMYGQDFVIGEQIARGGMGAICKAEVIGALLARRTKNVAVVVKLADNPVSELS